MGISAIHYQKKHKDSLTKYQNVSDFPKISHPLVRGVDIGRFFLKETKFIVPFPYNQKNTRSPIPIKELAKDSKFLA